MTLPPLELLLVLGVIGFYLQDSAMLLHYDEIVVVRHGRRWQASAGSSSQIGGRYPYLPDPLQPASPLFRSGWLADPARARREHWAGFDHYLAALDTFRPACWTLWSLLLIWLPLLLWRSASPTIMLGLALLIYLNVLKIGLRIWRYRRVLELSGKQALSLGFELLCCPPHAINVVRRLCARRGLHGNAIDAARRLLIGAERSGIADAIDGRLAMALDFHDGDTRLIAAKQRLELLR
jgi:hypothetical protein